MKKILTIAIIAILAANFANASTNNGGKQVKVLQVLSASKTSHAKFVKISAKEFAVKNMQDTKDILIDNQSTATNDYTTTTTAAR